MSKCFTVASGDCQRRSYCLPLSRAVAKGTGSTWTDFPAAHTCKHATNYSHLCPEIEAAGLDDRWRSLPTENLLFCLKTDQLWGCCWVNTSVQNTFIPISTPGQRGMIIIPPESAVSLLYSTQDRSQTSPNPQTQAAERENSQSASSHHRPQKAPASCPCDGGETPDEPPTAAGAGCEP